MMIIGGIGRMDSVMMMMDDGDGSCATPPSVQAIQTFR
jgi:hypothetical protein